MDEIKTLANCTDDEFLSLTYDIYEAVEDWFELTKIADIRKQQPELKIIPQNADEKTQQRIEEENEKLKFEQSKKNVKNILKACLKEHPKETARIIRMCCFVDPDDDSQKITYYMKAFNQMIANEDVIGFFQSLVSLAETLGITL